ncbi:DegT/DnrJ/EryC1/StrS family aminotransferase [Legionella jamestowniensis]|uniref:Aminotransferase DegT n=1 Tax=Legionella jamestowniensis TaxID=455 RepID=A0A0W0UU68_9GAMM|nr:DegT/DnrJ/EryC1/StrS family aminotransferase [Legionella jamestowniensis]KTD11412.1 polysaccharide biosynthesis protein [Legionella jamestowniensis]OCH98831.1 aminotransferase DegT [Legionella jamestowniensis]SFL67687.1 UDP-2-acetamido-2-deoxy-ribo-hexuluronate aminotransferase [Legionella jamestowniensis DSM 19215]
MQFIDLKKQYKLIESDILQGIQAVLEHGQYIMGPEIVKLEEHLAKFLGVKHAIVNSSGTDALLMALMALEIEPGDEVITSPFSFFATAEVIALCQAKPVFVDIDPLTYNIDPAQIESKITSRTKAIMPVSLYGQCADMHVINAVAKRHGLPVVEDAAQSFGATYHGVYSGALTTIGCTSFFPSKPLGGYGDSGACFTDDDILAERMLEIRIHGQNARYCHRRIGINGRMDTIQAAILLEKMKLFPDEIVMRQRVAERYEQLLSGIVNTPSIMPGNTSVFAQYTIEVPNRNEFQKKIQELGIPTAVHYPVAMHQQEALAYLGYKLGDFPHAERASKHVVSLPMHPYMSLEEQQRVANAVESCLATELAGV